MLHGRRLKFIAPWSSYCLYSCNLTFSEFDIKTHPQNIISDLKISLVTVGHWTLPLYYDTNPAAIGHQVVHHPAIIIIYEFYNLLIMSKIGLSQESNELGWRRQPTQTKSWRHIWTGFNWGALLSLFTHVLNDTKCWVAGGQDGQQNGKG